MTTPIDPGGHRTCVNRRSIRLKGYDYSQAGAYFITIVAQDRMHLFGEVINGEMQLNAAGRMILAEWEALPQRFSTIELDAFIIMPNHVHGIIVIIGTNKIAAGVGANVGANVGAGVTADVGAGLVPAPNNITPPTVGATTDGPTVGATTDGPTVGATTDGPTVGATTRVAPTVGDIVGAFKSITTVSYIRGVKQCGWPPFPRRLWQRNYYEHIIRNDESLNRIRRYIADNPARWALDRENTNAGAGSHKPENAWPA